MVVILLFVIGGIGFLSYRTIDKQIPDSIRMIVNEEQKLDFSLPVKGQIVAKTVGALSVNDKKLEKSEIRIDFAKPFTLYSKEPGSYKVKLKLFGLMAYKNIQIDVMEEKYLYPCGSSVGIKINTDGILVLGTGIIRGKDGLNYEPALNILKSGDYIVSFNGENVENKKKLMEMIEKCNGNDIQLEVLRNNERMKVIIKPVLGSDGRYKIGAWIRDDTQGIGTLTYVDEDGSFGALGHGITDVDTGLLMNVKKGGLYRADIVQINKGEKGTPGEVVGIIRKGNGDHYGSIDKNTRQGIFGHIDESAFSTKLMKKYPIGLKQDIKTGKATILCQVSDRIEEYDIEIEKVELNTENNSKGMVLHITDKKLLSLTNGIVQGMSGSPIIQNGKIIGAVTHVFVQDSTRGYGIFVENMMRFSDNKHK
ncbi:stage IV sporulation protein B [[Clostridium] polysaccharolyticum]|uniref:Stage IV sporulation protein B n=1 Tax=[Clostridium] polysaccharolyticum TaxID=29364 RepID=A0A1I0BAV7_9FIRM|nr:stage IV sporulation protein B [[Clostridium] polysaccharolyticum]